MSLALFAQESDSTEADTDYIEEVVTATSRETTILEVPYNISTLSGDEISARTILDEGELLRNCLLYTSPSPRDLYRSRMPSSA